MSVGVSFLRRFPGMTLLLLGLASPCEAWVAEPIVLGHVPSTDDPIQIDGRLCDDAWRQALVMELPWETEPGENVPAPVRTTVFLIHDEHYLYVAFRAEDPNPGAIRAHYSDRNRAHRDDSVGIILDPANDNRRAFSFSVNPLGVQMDASLSDVGGRSHDSSWDAIWRSAARITSSGFQAEIAIPFSVLRFSNTTGPQTWGIFPFRIYPRSLRHHLAHVPFDRNLSCRICQYPKFSGFDGVTPGKALEFLPTVTAHRHDTLDGDVRMQSGDLEREAGISVRWGLTSSLTLQGTANPDFSQVEADAGQLDINTRHALFFPEKRPFFLEGADFFATPIDAVYTRSVVQPSGGLKLTGKEGPHGLGVFVARDTATSFILPDAQSSSSTVLDRPNDTSVVRYRHDVGTASTMGLLFTSRSGDGYFSRTGGIDSDFRITPVDRVQIQFLASETEYPEEIAQRDNQPEGAFSGHAWRVLYTRSSRDWEWWANLREIGEDFRADTGYLTRVGTTSTGAGLRRIFNGARGGFFNRFSLGVDGFRTEGVNGKLTDEQGSLSIRGDGPWQSTVFAILQTGREEYGGEFFSNSRQRLFVNVRPTGGFTCHFDARYGDAVDYANARQGELLRLAPGFTYNLGRHLYFEVDHTFERLAVTGGTLYEANLAEIRAIYHLDARTFFRAILQYTDISRDPTLYLSTVPAESRNLFSQLLFSYKVNPQTVLYLGYSDASYGQQLADLVRENRTFFLKMGYALFM